MAVPGRALQEQFWDSWNTTNRTGGREHDQYTELQLHAARAATARAAAGRSRPLRILDFGCGTGWLGAGLIEFGDVTAVDLSPASIEHGRRTYPQIDFHVGDLLEVDVGGPFDVVVSADVISHVSNHQLFVQRVADLLRPGGVLLLMTQNGAIWRRNSNLAPQHPGQIRQWPTLGQLRTLLAADFDLKRVGTIHPVGDRGVLRVVNSRWIAGALRRVGLGRAWRRTRELARLGCELTLEAERR
jgi:2-polyprenyl-3-methyl-5-hydroxy-6-metoxy-1,4-benzoquinol methylase